LDGFGDTAAFCHRHGEPDEFFVTSDERDALPYLGTENQAPLTAIPVNGGSFTITIPATSIVTVIG
jgi:hypothetical protein